MLLLISLVAVFFLIYKSFFTTNQITQKKALILKIGYLAHPGYLPLFCADHQDYLEKDNIQMQLVRFESSPIMISAFVNNEIQVAPLATVSALSLESLDPGRFKVFAVSSETIHNYLTAIVTLPAASSGISSMYDLKGKKIGVFPGPAARTLFSLVFEKYNLKDGQDVFLQELAPSLHIQALSSGQVAALATYEPIATQAVIELNAYKLLPAAVESNVLSPTQGGSWLISSLVIRQNPSAVKFVVEAINSGIDFIKQNPNLLSQIISEYTSVSLKVARKAPLVTYSKLEDIDITSYQKHADLMYENGVVSKRINVSTLLIDMSEFD